MSSLTAYLEAANAPLTDPTRTLSWGDEESPRFVLYHFALSLCSQKVRLTLTEAGASYRAHDINLSMPLLANYDPGYVRLRMLGAEGLPLATGCSGRSSTATEGFDPLVVPTLVDLAADSVHVDSAHICLYVAQQVAPHLAPAPLADALQRELDIVDQMPQVALFYGAHPEGDFRPQRLRSGMAGVHSRKIEKIEAGRARALEVFPELAPAYEAKLAKERAAEAFVTSSESMREATRTTVDVVAALEGRLEQESEFLLGPLTLADLVWAVALFRLQWLGMAFCWEGKHPLNPTPCPLVEAYGQRLFGRPSFRTATLDWPGMPSSEWVPAEWAPSSKSV